MRRWAIEARDAERRVIGQNDAVYLHPYASENEAEDWGYARWPDAYRVRAYLWQDDRDDWEILSPGE